MTGQDASTLRLHGVPHVTVEVIVTGQQETTALAEGDTRDAANYVVVRVERQLLIGANIEEPASGVVGSRRERVAVGEERDGVYVGLVTREGLLAGAFANVPQLGGGVAGGGHEGVHVRGEGQRHDVARVASERSALLAGFNVPESAGHVSRAGHYLAVVQEAAAGQVARVAGQLPGDAHVALAGLQAVYGADVVEAPARHVRPGGGVGAGHHPGGAERDGVHLVGGVRVPHYELAVLRGGDEVPRVGAPVHGVYLGEMPPERAARPHLDAADGFQIAGRLDEVGVAGGLAGVPDDILQCFGFLPQTVELVHVERVTGRAGRRAGRGSCRLARYARATIVSR